MSKSVIVVGGGASGLLAGIVLARGGAQVTILEKMNKIGKKLRATGNGKCNLTNLIIDKECYRGNQIDFAYNIIEKFGVQDTIEFFEELGIMLTDDEGYVYPYSQQASTVVECMEIELRYLKVKIKTNEEVVEIHKCNNMFQVKTNTYTYVADNVILSTGGCVSKHLGSDGSGYQLAEMLGHSIIKPLPALVKLISNHKIFEKLAGVRSYARVQLEVDEIVISSDIGELQLTKNGISGIPTFQNSRYASLGLYDQKPVYAYIDYMPDVEYEELKNIIIKKIKKQSHKSTSEILLGFIHKKITDAFIEFHGIKGDTICSQLQEDEIDKIVNVIKAHKIQIIKTDDYDNAQVTCGGINVKEVCQDTLESKKCQGIYITGELLDVDGKCGGYNLQWAWSTGFMAAKSIIGKDSI